uniref:Uncharacterized protein n=1 Tax=Anguilla anguilla TaxID=7936 RepID=A0A0E9QPC4_ANGAN
MENVESESRVRGPDGSTQPAASTGK